VNIAVLGCGPAGLIAADELDTFGHKVTILSKKQKSVISGAQFIHKNIGWYLPLDPDFIIEVSKAGTAQGYATNVYGDPLAKTSWANFQEGDLPGWSMQSAYTILWNLWNGKIIDIEITPYLIGDLLERYDRVFSTVPLRTICHSGHTFTSQKVYIVHQEPSSIQKNVMYYNGKSPNEGGYLWYRFSRLEKYESWEYSEYNWLWGGASDISSLPVQQIWKPLSTNCDCHPGLIRIGRYGEWDKRVLTHHIPEKVRNALF
jgi:hypothetical protein